MAVQTAVLICAICSALVSAEHRQTPTFLHRLLSPSGAARLRGKAAASPSHLQVLRAAKPIIDPNGGRGGRTRLSSSATVINPPVAHTAPGTKSSRAKLEEYVEQHGGNRVISKILVANNGMAATKAINSMRQWAYMEFGDEGVFEFVVMATPEDLKANAEFIKLADRIVEVPGGVNRNNYANVDLIVDIATREEVDAVWPGWGHASENPKLPEKLNDNGIAFIGPKAPVMAALGDKIAANILAQSAGVPSIPWSGDGLTVDLSSGSGDIPKETFDKAMVTTVEEAVEAASRIGYPVMLKASEGGGGKGIRLSDNEEDLRSNFVQVSNEVPGSPMFMMQLCTNARHIEVQIVGDQYGQAVALSGRDCSTQRRFQKIFEEGPPTSIVPPDTFREMELAAQRLTSSIGYEAAGTVEYLYNAAEDKFYFLELNPRLQVEHPVTEEITGINLPATQLQVIMGIPLHRVPDIRRFWQRADPQDGTDTIDFVKEPYRTIDTHCIAARVTAENPDEGFKPTSGSIDRLDFRSTNNVWGYFSVGANGGIHEYADSQFGHLFARGSTREQARKALVIALKRLDVRGEIRTAVEYLSQLLETREFMDNTIDTSWLDGLIKQKAVGVPVNTDDVVVAAILFRAKKQIEAKEAELIGSLGRGQLYLKEVQDLNTISPLEITFGDTKYAAVVKRTARDLFRIEINGQTIEARVREQTDGSLLVSVGGANRKVYGFEEPLGLRMNLDGTTVLLPTVYDPSECRSDVNGKVVRYLQEDGAEVKAGEPYIEVEAMKMIMALKAGEDGKIRHEKSAGSIISAGDLLGTVELKDPSKVKKITPFEGTLNITDVPIALGEDNAAQRLELVMKGFEHDIDTLVPKLITESGGDAKKASDTVSNLLQQFLSVEEQFAGRSADETVGELIKQHKDDLQQALDVKAAHRQLPRRNKLVLALLRLLQTFPNRFGGWTMPSEVEGCLQRLSQLEGRDYGPIAIEADRLYRDCRILPFEERLRELRDQLKRTTGPEDLQKLAEDPALSAGVDLLSELFSDSEEGVKFKAMEVYIRRVYRAHNIISIHAEDRDGLTILNWRFRQRDLPADQTPVRHGYMVVLKGTQDFKDKMPRMLEIFREEVADQPAANAPVNVFHIAFGEPPLLEEESAEEQAYVKDMQDFIKTQKAQLDDLQVRIVNLLVPQAPRLPRYFSFMHDLSYEESRLRRDMRPTFPPLLELERLEQNFDLQRLPAVDPNCQVYLGSSKAKMKKGPSPQTVYVRSVSHDRNIFGSEEAMRFMVDSLDQVQRAMLDPRVQSTASGRIYLHVIPMFEDTTPQQMQQTFERIIMELRRRYSDRLLKLRVDQIEIKAHIRDSEGNKVIRLAANSEGGSMWLQTDAVLETPNPITGEPVKFRPLSGPQEVTFATPYPAMDKVALKRSAARRTGSTYVYDFLGLIEVALIQRWSEYLKDLSSLKESPAAAGTKAPDIDAIPENFFSAVELVTTDSGELVEKRDWKVGANTIGMLAWRCTLKTPEYPEGREIVLVANDVTFQGGSFGVTEDLFFQKASQYARERGLPRIYVACNSGARIGLWEALKTKFRVAWVDPGSPSLGFKYLYLTKHDYDSVPPGTVNVHPELGEDGETRYVIDDIIGEGQSIGVENLRGSGLIAGETSRAYDETFTLSYVTGRSVGIGAYLVRLGQRTIQMINGPLLLTGYQALNKLLGREVYASQDQLGGPQIMYQNGVSHNVVENDQQGVREILKWLSYVPKTAKDLPPPLTSVDPPSRNVEYVPPSTPYDPRHMLEGTTLPNGTFLSGFFDRGSFTEYLGGWGKGVVVGRARLGGIPMGCIAVETRTVEARIPADPANPESREAVMPQAGQVWFPDSAFKTAQAIEDFNRAENLPLIIFANWRGFSGGTRDMFGEILKFGSMIVDALRTYRHPVFIYIPPNGELRGGAWVVVDPTINEDKMEMYADVDSRGGILEPPGICEVKFRSADQIDLMHRLDPELRELDKQLEDCMVDSDALDLKAKIKKREDALIPLYLQLAHSYADLHDRAGRMKAKGVIRDALSWPRSRDFFYWRTRRRMAEDAIQDRVRRVHEAPLDKPVDEAFADLLTSNGVDPNDDKAVAAFIESDSPPLQQWLDESIKKAVLLKTVDLLEQHGQQDLIARLKP
ncbi:unnamed protein product [Vitrella brassicaformis CCMP3155]|uniref:Uncharacterized protein n=4 Tax=Vitrella brassicaformis TaxID=1169539 RepID=A0A0G4FEH6_VITBC|nr:unnamed protein product [Vitrella brassicaformis CCMP3155]|eukprot:CEM11630.1 unnamed protein product [Vitrella brassicaformis CCMP3155]